MKEILHFLSSLLGRSAISIPRVSYVFAEKLGDSCGVIWDSVRYEFCAMSAVFPLSSRADLPKACSSDIVCTDASETKIGASFVLASAGG